MAALEEDCVDIVFHDTAYNLSVTAQHAPESASEAQGLLAIDLEELSTGASWHGEFTSAYIENITSKTGSFKRFSILVKMLLGALRQQTETVFLDLLTYADLEALKSRRAGKAGNTSVLNTTMGAANTAAAQRSNKRYLILTYVAEFDRVHYPLPLAFEEAPSMSSLQRLTRRLRREVSTYRHLAGLGDAAPALTAAGLPAAPAAALASSLSGLQRENHVLRQMLQEQQAREGALAESVRGLQMQLAGATEAIAASEIALEKLRAASRAEVKRLRAELEEAGAVAAQARGAAAVAAEAATLPSGPPERERETVAQLRASNAQLRERLREVVKEASLRGIKLASASTIGTGGSGSTVTGRGRSTSPYPRAASGTSAGTGTGAAQRTSSSSGASVGSRGRSGTPGSVASRRSASASSRGSVASSSSRGRTAAGTAGGSTRAGASSSSPAPPPPPQRGRHTTASTASAAAARDRSRSASSVRSTGSVSQRSVSNLNVSSHSGLSGSRQSTPGRYSQGQGQAQGQAGHRTSSHRTAPPAVPTTSSTRSSRPVAAALQRSPYLTGVAPLLASLDRARRGQENHHPATGSSSSSGSGKAHNRNSGSGSSGRVSSQSPLSPLSVAAVSVSARHNSQQPLPVPLPLPVPIHDISSWSDASALAGDAEAHAFHARAAAAMAVASSAAVAITGPQQQQQQQPQPQLQQQQPVVATLQPRPGWTDMPPAPLPATTGYPAQQPVPVQPAPPALAATPAAGPVVHPPALSSAGSFASLQVPYSTPMAAVTPGAGTGSATGTAVASAAAASAAAVAAPAAAPVPAPAPAPASRYDASADIDDIDARLQQLQEFLRAAKAGSIGTPLATA